MNAKTVTATCTYCEEKFQAQRSTAAYCSASCRQMAYKKRLDEKYKKYIQEENSSIQALSVNPNSPFKKLASTIKEDSVNLPSTNSINVGKCSLKQESNINQESTSDASIVNEMEAIRKFLNQLSIDNANEKLKEWIEEILKFNSKGMIYKIDLSTLIFNINLFCKYDAPKLPPNYPFLSFINNYLKPKLENMYMAIKASKELKFHFKINEEAREKLEKVYKAIQE